MHMYTVWGSGMWNVIASWNIDDYLDSDSERHPSAVIISLILSLSHSLVFSLIFSFSLSISRFLFPFLSVSVFTPLSTGSHCAAAVFTQLSVLLHLTLCVHLHKRHTFLTNWWKCEQHTVSSVCVRSVRACLWPCLRPEGLHWFLETKCRANVC